MRNSVEIGNEEWYMKNVRTTSVLFVALLTIFVAGIVLAVRGNTQDAESGKLTVTASYYPLYDFAQHVGGDKAHVTNMTPAGAEPHDYEPSPRQLVTATKSDVFIYNGTGMEPWAESFLKDYTNTKVTASGGVSLLDGESHEDGSTETAAHADEVRDPHFWLDPVLAQQIVTNIATGFSKADPENQPYYQARAQKYIQQLAALDDSFGQGLAQCQTRTIVTSHEAFSYLAKRYNLDVAAIAGISPEEEPSAAKLAELTNLVREKQIKYVFFESLASPKLAETLAQETGAQTLVFDPIEGLSDADQKAGKDYIGVQRQNLANLRTALACQ
jgi:zinc transport system substrate-binding protein